MKYYYWPVLCLLVTALMSSQWLQPVAGEEEDAVHNLQQKLGKNNNNNKGAVGVAVLWLKTLPNLAVLVSVLFFVVMTVITLDAQERGRRSKLRHLFSSPKTTTEIQFKKLFPDTTLNLFTLLVILLTQVLIVSVLNFLPIVIVNLLCGVLVCVGLARASLRDQLLSVCWKFQLAIVLGHTLFAIWPFPVDVYEMVTAALLLLFSCLYVLLNAVDSKDAEANIAVLMHHSSSMVCTDIVIRENDEESDDSNSQDLGYPSMLSAEEEEENEERKRELAQASLFPATTGTNYANLTLEEQLELEQQERKQRNKEAFARARAEELAYHTQQNKSGEVKKEEVTGKVDENSNFFM